MPDKYEMLYGSDGRWQVWSFVDSFELMDTAMDFVKILNEQYLNFQSNFDEGVGENDTN